METKDLIIDKGKMEDAKAMHYNLWKHKESAKYVLWSVTTTIEEAENRLKRWIEWQKEHMQWLVYDKVSKEAIGYASIEEIGPNKYGDIGIAIGKEYTGKGLGSQILEFLLSYIKNLGAKEVEYSFLSGNIASQKLAEKYGFKYVKTEKRIRNWDNKEFDELIYTLEFKGE